MTRQCAVCGREFDYAAKPGRPPVTCSPECARKRKNRQSGVNWGASRECPPEAHGTATGYNTYHCGCAKCSRWARLYKQGHRAKAKG